MAKYRNTLHKNNQTNARQRYDFLSTGCGALAVTGYCVLRGQDPATAAGITVTATVAALVANELLFSGNGDSSGRQ